MKFDINIVLFPTIVSVFEILGRKQHHCGGGIRGAEKPKGAACGRSETTQWRKAGL